LILIWPPFAVCVKACLSVRHGAARLQAAASDPWEDTHVVKLAACVGEAAPTTSTAAKQQSEDDNNFSMTSPLQSAPATRGNLQG
jgi:hypothetical protein